MAVSIGRVRDRGIELAPHELAGAIGDSVTVLPIVVAVVAVTDLTLTWILLGFAAFQVVWGLHYGVPVSVEPMKALAGLLIAGAITLPSFLIAGLFAGVVLLVAGTTGLLSGLREVVGEPVVRGIQVAVALLLVETGLGLGLGDPWIAAGGVVVAGAVVAVGYRRASALAVLAVGLGAAALGTGFPSTAVPVLAPSIPAVGAVDPVSTLGATGAQLAMTVGNAAVATSLLLEEFYDADVSPDDLARSMGAMTLVSVPLGGMPMCHGSGGVAGKHAFGARTAGANVLLGVLYAAAAVLAVELVMAFPMAILGVVLALVAVELGRVGLDSEHLALTLGVGILGVLTNVGLAFLVGTLVWLVVDRRRGGRRAEDRRAGDEPRAEPDVDG